jgi:hypothetical protein
MPYHPSHALQKGREAQARHRTKINQADPIKAILQNMLWDTRKRAKAKGLEHDLDYEYLMSIYIKTCNITGELLLWERGHGKPQENSPSLDRLDPRKGYTKDNVWLISYRMNRIKNDATPDELELIAERLRAKIEGRL